MFSFSCLRRLWLESNRHGAATLNTNLGNIDIQRWARVGIEVNKKPSVTATTYKTMREEGKTKLPAHALNNSASIAALNAWLPIMDKVTA